MPDGIDIRKGAEMSVAIEPPDADAAKEIRQMAREMTHETVRDGYFG